MQRFSEILKNNNVEMSILLLNSRPVYIPEFHKNIIGKNTIQVYYFIMEKMVFLIHILNAVAFSFTMLLEVPSSEA